MKIVHLLSATALASLGFTGLPTVAFAQSTAQQEAQPPAGSTGAQSSEEEDEAGQDVIVTGSLIPRPQFDGTIPGVQVTAQQIEARGFTNTLDVLNDIPLVGPGATPFGNNGGQPASLGAAFVDLLDLGTQRSLTLVNGRRFVSGNAASLFVAANATGGQVDLNVLPTALIERTDVLTVGGAVAYGSDAIAGVVNVVLRDNFEGIRLGALSNITQRGDGGAYRLTATAGTNFGGGRGNIAVAFEYNRDNALNGDDRPNFGANFIAPTSFRNGAVRNQSFVPGLDLAANARAFLPTASDLVPNNIAGSGFRGGSILLSDPGTVFQVNANITNLFPAGIQGLATTDPQSATLSPGFRPQNLITQAGNTNLVPGTTILVGTAGCSLTLTNFCRFAPSSLPGTGAAGQATFAQAIITRFAPTFAAQGTQAQRNALALDLLQANTPTPREFLAQNPNTDINAFVGSLIPNYLDVATTNGTLAAFLPRTAVPLQFDAAGNLRSITTAIIADPANTPSTTGGATTPDGLNQTRFTTLRVAQDRYIANLIGHFDLTDNIRLYTENLYSRVVNIAPFNVASSNTIASATPENAPLVLSINNPFLDAADRSVLSAAGVTDRFVLSRTNQDLFEGNTARVTSNTYRSVVGLKGDFGAFGRNFQWDTSFTYGRAESSGNSFQIRDIEYALAIDAVQGATGPICRAQTTPGIVGTTPPGVVGTEVVRERDANGLIVERTIRRTVTQQQVNDCRPLNVFGAGQFSTASRDYVTARTGFSNLSQQYFAKANFSGSFFDLPGGSLGFGTVGEYRRESLEYSADELSRTGATRTAALAATEGYIEAIELGGELAIPIFGEDFNIPLFRNLEFKPGIRYVRQRGAAPDVRLLNGTLADTESEGRWNQIYTLAGAWKPIQDITIRGNYTRSIRQPSIVELFLGGQPAFSAVTDPCSNQQISLGVRPTVRRANCVAAVRTAGLAASDAEATTFLNNYVPSGAGVQGNFSGSPGLLPERGKSWTVGGLLSPRFLPGLNVSADYINVEVRDQIVPQTIVSALQICYDSPGFPNTASEVGVNVCDFFSRIPQGRDRPFEVDNGFNSGFINLGGIRVEAINAVFQYKMPIDEWFNDADLGTFEIYSNVYHVIKFSNSPNGSFSDTQESAGSVSAGRPKWEVQLRGRYDNKRLYAQWVWNWTDKTQLFAGGAPVQGTNEQNESQDFILYPAYGIHDATIGMYLDDRRTFNLQLTVRNVLDQLIIGPVPQAFALPNSNGRVDDFGRRFVVSANVRF